MVVLWPLVVLMLLGDGSLLLFLVDKGLLLVRLMVALLMF
jgi:hypothetical protein